MDGKVALITGAAAGIGKATAELLSREGASVAVTDVDDESGEAVAKALRDSGAKARFWHLDVSDEGEVHRVVDEAAAHFGGLHVLVNNAGIGGVSKPTHEIEADDWNRVIRINVNGVFFCTKHAIPHLKSAGGGSIVNLSSIYGLVSAPDAPPYHASKGAVRLMTKTDALFYAGDGIRVNSVHPGFIWTPMVEEFLEGQESPEAAREGLVGLHPIGRLGRPEEVASAILFLASDESSFMTGSEVVVDGGYTAR
jgi:NAD(P)-dependent dehydrogenase (short-subunit alcohol dehydrogenase family)